MLRAFYYPARIFLLTQIVFQIIPLLYRLYLSPYHLREANILALTCNLLGLISFAVFYYLHLRAVENKKIYPLYVPNMNRLIFFSFFYLFWAPVILLIHCIIVDKVPFFVAISGGGVENIAYARESFFKTLPLSLEFFFKVFEQILPMIMTVLLYSVAFSKKNKTCKILGHLFLFFLVVSAMFSMVKMTPVVVVTLVFFSLAMSSNQKPYKLITTAFLIFCSLIGLMATLASGTDGWELFMVSVQDMILRRIGLVQSEVMTYYFDIFPKRQDYLYGKGIRLFAVATGESDFQLGNFVYHQMFPNSPYESGWSNSGYIGEAWADFGWFGIFLYPLMLAIILSKFESRNIKRQYQFEKSTAVFLNVLIVLLISYLSVSSMMSTSIIIFFVLIMAFKNLFFKKVYIEKAK